LKQFLTVLESLITIVLVLAGLAGISYRTFRDGGWFMQGVGKMADAYLSYPLVGLAATVLAVLAIRSWHGRRQLGHRSKIFDYLVYLFMAAGIYFIGSYILTGKF